MISTHFLQTAESSVSLVARNREKIARSRILSTTSAGINQARKGYSLIELLVVITIISLLGYISEPALQSLAGAGTINKAISDLDQTIKLARTYAMANHTFVRVVFSQIPAGTSGQTTPVTLVLVIYPASGALDSTNNTPQDMGNSALWPLLNHPVVLPNLVFNDKLNTSSPDTSNDLYPSQSDMASASESFTRPIQTFSPAPTFACCVQLNPSGETQVLNGTPARYIKMAFDRLSPQSGKDPFILRIYGINGRIDILRKENGIE